MIRHLPPQKAFSFVPSGIQQSPKPHRASGYPQSPNPTMTTSHRTHHSFLPRWRDTLCNFRKGGNGLNHLHCCHLGTCDNDGTLCVDNCNFISQACFCNGFIAYVNPCFDCFSLKFLSVKIKIKPSTVMKARE